MTVTVPRIVLALLVVGTLFPALALAGLFWSAMMIGYGLTLVYKSSIVNGSLVLAWSISALYGLIIVIELVAHFWRTPWENPRGVALTRSVIGLLLGWVSIPLFLFVPALWRDITGAHAFFVSLLLTPVPFVISLWLAVNFIRERRQGNLRTS